MVVTYIPASGYTNFNTIISDNANPASGTYAWYLTDATPKGVWPLKELVNIDEATGVSLSKKGYNLNETWVLESIIDVFTDYENMLKAIGTWEKASTLLYLNIQNSWGSNIAIYPSYATPTTLVQVRGTLSNLTKERFPNAVKIRVQFNQKTTAV